ncbi:MAG: tRNA-dihydrouridine synthase [Candidatus Roizmanbacteria bacterium GW2011_GWC2_34_23]|uniref:tRNA-dihydrouridine synthase n=1 Tax=Candidatus Roizmanbacteria bacterium GW2011_GWC2_34_23 TaxID=1618484 RepID=A0A0G0BEN0_9BACT|nr:MAG: tRNA-dihydrouridine synthase [Candidatus Roizmanbacteria bacterium GW2011_GWC2_34_23]
MDGVTDAPFRYITDIYGKPDIIYTEFISVKGLILGKAVIQRMLLHHKTETTTVAQFFGCEPEYFYQAALVALEKGYDGVDINMGCPDKSVFHRGAGAGLILQPKLAKEIILSVKKGVKDGKEKYNIERNITVSIKTRTGYREPQTKEWISNLLETEPDVICIHARTFAQKYSGLADWSQIGIAADLAKNTKTKIFGNGDIKSKNQAIQRIKEFNLAGVLIGRAALGNPWIFKGVIPTTKERFKVLLEHCKKFVEFFPTANLSIMRKHLGWYAKDFPHAAEVRNELMQVNSIENVKKILSKTQEFL